jgi:hypothetical protein
MSRDHLSGSAYQGYYSPRILSGYITGGLAPREEYLYTRLGVLLKEKSIGDGYPLYKD